MKRIVSCVFALSALLTAVSSNVGYAADLHGMVYKAPPAPPPIITSLWTGCYVGGNVGWGLSQTSTNQTGLSDGTVISPPDNFGSQNASSVIGGAQIGCDYQFDGPWVIGLRGQFDYGNLSGQDTLPAFPTFYMNDKIHDIATATGRLGYAMAPGWLAYVEGGGAWTRDDLQIYGSGPPAFLSESGTANRYGYDVGAGVEYMICPNWSVFLEYNYMGFGTKNVSLVNGPGVAGPTGIVAVKQDVQTAMVGINWHLNWTGPLTARF
jgi:outer membrane immunogenic protein